MLEAFFKATDEKVKKALIATLNWIIDEIVELFEKIDKAIKDDPEVEKLAADFHAAGVALKAKIAAAEVKAEAISAKVKEDAGAVEVAAKTVAADAVNAGEAVEKAAETIAQ
jgi:hypothetical protein